MIREAIRIDTNPKRPEKEKKQQIIKGEKIAGTIIMPTAIANSKRKRENTMTGQPILVLIIAESC